MQRPKKHVVERDTYSNQRAEKAPKAASNFQDTNVVGNYNSEESKTGPSGPRSKVPISEIKKMSIKSTIPTKRRLKFKLLRYHLKACLRKKRIAIIIEITHIILILNMRKNN